MTSISYPYKTSVVLLACKTIATGFSANIQTLSQVRSNWTPEYATDLLNRTDQTIDKYIGADPKMDLLDASAKLYAIQLPALRDLTSFKIQVEVDFPDEASLILRTLGFNRFFRRARNLSQEDLIANLADFREGMTDELKTKLTSKGLSPELIVKIIGYADSARDANAQQEMLKESTKEITEEAKSAILDIYNEVIGICKIARGCFRYDPVLKNQFSFAKVVRNMSTSPAQTSTPEEPTTPAENMM